MSISNRASWALIFGGLSLTAGIVLLRRQKRLGLGDSHLVTRLTEAAPVVGVTRSGGMVMQHLRSENMPIKQRVRSIQDLVWKGINRGEMRKLALQITRKCPERDGQCEAKAIYDYMKRHVRYTGDIAPVMMPNGKVEAIDLYQRADRTLEFGGGDCDDHNILGATLLSLNGIPARLRVTAEKGAGSDYGHIYVIAGLEKTNPKRWVALDTTLPGNNNFGREVPFGEYLDFPV